MRGQVLGVDRVSGEGQISGEDGQRYTFKPEDWSDQKAPAVGLTVDFTTDGTRAARIFRLPDVTKAHAPPPAPMVRPADRKNKLVAALLAFFLGTLGLHRFYLGRIGTGILMLVLTCTIVGLVVTGIWSLVDTIRYLIMSDEEFSRRYDKPA